MRSRWDILKHYALKIGIYLCAFLFVYAAVSKLLDFETFETQLGQSPLLSAYAKPVAIGVPLLELLISIFLMVPRFRFWGLYAFYGLMVMFTTYIVIILNFSDFVPCSCGGVLEKMGWKEHLIFNTVFVLFSALSVWFLSSEKRKILLTLCSLTIFSIGVVTIVFLSSEKQIKQNNAFQRRYVPHPIEKIGSYDLIVNSYYIAGMSDLYIYLGNVTTPLQILQLDTQLKVVDTIKVSISHLDLPYKRVKIQIIPPYFYVGDGTVPILFRGLIGDWKAEIFSYDDAYFTQYAAIDSMRIGISTLSSLSKANAIGMIEIYDDQIDVHINHHILKKQIDGRFDSDGMLLYNQKYEQLIYAYYYRNAFEMVDKLSQLKYTGKTIDTISRAIVDVAHYSKSNSFKLGANSMLVNKNSATYGDYLYIHSDRLGKYEDETLLKSAAIIDVYNVRDGAYAFSFYLYHQKNQKLNHFFFYKEILVAIVNDQLWLYRLKTDYFKVST